MEKRDFQKKSGLRDSNPGPLNYETCVLPSAPSDDTERWSKYEPSAKISKLFRKEVIDALQSI